MIKHDKAKIIPESDNDEVFSKDVDDSAMAVLFALIAVILCGFFFYVQGAYVSKPLEKSENVSFPPDTIRPPPVPALDDVPIYDGALSHFSDYIYIKVDDVLLIQYA